MDLMLISFPFLASASLVFALLK